MIVLMVQDSYTTTPYWFPLQLDMFIISPCNISQVHISSCLFFSRKWPKNLAIVDNTEIHKQLVKIPGWPMPFSFLSLLLQLKLVFVFIFKRTKYVVVRRHDFLIETEDSDAEHEPEKFSTLSCSCERDWQVTLGAMSMNVTQKPGMALLNPLDLELRNVEL